MIRRKSFPIIGCGPQVRRSRFGKMKLDVTCMRYLSKEDYRVLIAIEMGCVNFVDKFYRI